jgi:hypothetical protein
MYLVSNKFAGLRGVRGSLAHQDSGNTRVLLDQGSIDRQIPHTKVSLEVYSLK